MKKRICVFTDSRAEYGILRPLLDEIKKDKGMALGILVAGAHLSPEFGMTYTDIEDDGFLIDEKIETVLSSDTPVGISKSMGLAIVGCAKAYRKISPDIILVLGDRFEVLCAAAAAHVARIPIGHMHGGELTEGAFDDAFRHSITKMSHLHFTAAEEYRNRVIQLGENPKRVFNVGALAVDAIRRLRLLSREQLEKRLDFRFGKKNLLVTFHSVTLEDNTSKRQFRELLTALDKYPETHIVFTKTNSDTYGRIINQMIDRHVRQNYTRAKAFTSMGSLLYLSTMRLVDGVVGNSSSGLVEAPSLRVGTVNIGDRQKGRVRVSSIIDCAPDKDAIIKAIDQLYSRAFCHQLKTIRNPYGDGNAAKKITEILGCFLKTGGIKKTFYDLPMSRKR